MGGWQWGRGKETRGEGGRKGSEVSKAHYKTHSDASIRSFGILGILIKMLELGRIPGIARSASSGGGLGL